MVTGITAKAICLLLALICFAVAALWKPNPPRVDLIAVGLALLTLSFLVP